MNPAGCAPGSSGGGGGGSTPYYTKVGGGGGSGGGYYDGGSNNGNPDGALMRGRPARLSLLHDRLHHATRAAER